MARLILSAGILTPLASWIALRNRGLPSASPPPIRAAMVISLMSFVNMRPRFASMAPFLCLMLCHLEWPDIDYSLVSAQFGFSLAQLEGEKNEPQKGTKSAKFLCSCAFLWLLLRWGLFQLRVERGSLPIVTARSALRVLAIHGIPKGEVHIRLKFLVIVVSDDLANALRAARKPQRIDGPRIGGEPVETIDLFPIRFKPREQIFRSFSSNIRDRLPI